MCVCVCVRERERERDGVCVCIDDVYVCREAERESMEAKGSGHS